MGVRHYIYIVCTPTSRAQVSILRQVEANGQVCHTDQLKYEKAIAKKNYTGKETDYLGDSLVLPVVFFRTSCVD